MKQQNINEYIIRHVSFKIFFYKKNFGSHFKHTLLSVMQNAVFETVKILMKLLGNNIRK